MVDFNELYNIYVRIKNGTATSIDLDEYEMFFLTCCCNKEYVEKKLENRYSKDREAN